MKRRVDIMLPAILAVGAWLRFWGLGTLPLIGDESYYWLWSRHLDWAYYDHPAGVALLVRLGTALGGSSEAGVRWLNALLGLGCIWLTYLLGARALSRRAGLLGAAAVALGAPYLITSRFVYTDALHLFTALLNLLCFRLLAAGGGASILGGLAFGLSLALLLNTKYSAYLYAAALGVGVLLDYRNLLERRPFWLGVGIGGIGVLPVLAWNAAHRWASFRWQFSHATTALGGEYSLLGGIYHALVYITLPLLLLALLGLGRLRTPAERLLNLVALFLLVPVLISPANSPRNLTTGLVFLLLLAGTRLPSPLRNRTDGAVAGLLALLLFGTALYGVGTLADLNGPSGWPHSSITAAIRRDTAGWRELGPLLREFPEPIFAVDYSIASQIRYYSGREAITAWGQYRIWGIPDLRRATFVAQDYLPPEVISSRLRRAFRRVEGPQRFDFIQFGVTKVVYIWQAEGLRWKQDRLLRELDFLALWRDR